MGYDEELTRIYALTRGDDEAEGIEVYSFGKQALVLLGRFGYVVRPWGEYPALCPEPPKERDEIFRRHLETRAEKTALVELGALLWWASPRGESYRDALVGISVFGRRVVREAIQSLFEDGAPPTTLVRVDLVPATGRIGTRADVTGYALRFTHGDTRIVVLGHQHTQHAELIAAGVADTFPATWVSAAGGDS